MNSLEERIANLQASNTTLTEQLNELKLFFHNKPATLEVLACLERESERAAEVMTRERKEFHSLIKRFDPDFKSDSFDYSFDYSCG